MHVEALYLQVLAIGLHIMYLLAKPRYIARYTTLAASSSINNINMHACSTAVSFYMHRPRMKLLISTIGVLLLIAVCGYGEESDVADVGRDESLGMCTQIVHA